MSRKYKFHNERGIYFVSFATVFWIDVFVRDLYFMEMADSLNFCIKNKGMKIFAWCIMPSHVHLIFRALDDNPSDLMRDLKTFTSKKLAEKISENFQESRREWILWMLKKAGEKKSNIKKMQFWQQHNKPIELWSPSVIDQKVDYIHNNPVIAGFVLEAQHWKYSSAIDYFGGKGMVEIDPLEVF